MPLDLRILERAGLHLEMDEVEALVNAAFQAALPPYPANPPLTALSTEERAFWDDAGIHLTGDDPDRQPSLRTAAKLASLLATAISPQQAARNLGVDRSRVSHRLRDKHLYAIRWQGRLRLPLFQFTDDSMAVVPGFPHLVPLLERLHPISVFNWFTLPNQDLALEGDVEQPVSPRDWLLSGGSPEVLVEKARGLHIGW